MPKQEPATQRAEQQRLDQWLYMARFVKTRALAQKMCSGRKVRLNGRHVSKPSQTVAPGAVLTMQLPKRVLVVEVQACAGRRGPPAEAQSLYRLIDADAR